VPEQAAPALRQEIVSLHQQLDAIELVKNALNEENIELRVETQAGTKHQAHTLKL